MFLLDITGEGNNEEYHFTAVDKKGKFDLTKEDIISLKNTIEK